MKPRIARSMLGAACALVAALLGAGCDSTGCDASAAPSMVRLTLHLPPEKDVAMPETVTVCEEPACRMAALPPVSANGTAATMTFPTSVARGDLFLAAGDVRRLEISWPIEIDGAFDPKDPRNQYDVQIVDAKGVKTGALSALVDYDHAVNTACGVDSWSGAASD